MAKYNPDSKIFRRRIPGYENYWCDIDGSIWVDRENGNAMSPLTHSGSGNKCRQVKLLAKSENANAKGFSVSVRRVVAATWMCVPIDSSANLKWKHKDGNITNCHVENIEIVKPKQKRIPVDLPMVGGSGGERTVTMTMTDLEKMMRRVAQDAAEKVNCNSQSTKAKE